MIETVAACDDAEDALADSRPFGDCAYILDRVFVQYRRRLELLAQRSESARRLQSAIGEIADGHFRILGDPALRVAVDSALVNVLQENDSALVEAAGVFEFVARNLVTDRTRPPLAYSARELHRIRDDLLPWIWVNERARDDPLGDYFRLCYSRYIHGLDLASPSQDVLDALSKGSALLRAVCPRLHHSALSHVSLIASVDTTSSPGFTSLTTPAIPGLVVLAPSVLKDPLVAAEHLLHEAMHSKFVDLEHTHALMHHNYVDIESPRIRPHWNRVQPGHLPGWSLNRSLTVCHVYTSLALFYTRVESSSEVDGFGPFASSAITPQIRRSLDRAEYLQQQLALNRTHLGAAGFIFVDWLGSILSMLDPSPPPPNSSVHLSLELYDREASKVQRLLRHANSDGSTVPAGWAKAMRESARREVQAAVRLLFTLHGKWPGSVDLQDIDRQLLLLDEMDASFSESAALFLTAREATSKALRVVPLEEYVRLNPQNRDELVGDIVLSFVEKSGAQLHDLLNAHVPEE